MPENSKEIEIWKAVTIEPFCEFYEVSNFGRVRSLDRENSCFGSRKYIRRGKLMGCSEDKDGYLRCRICAGDLQRSVPVHRLAGLAFIPNPENNPVINHKDGNKQNNSVENLEWVTLSENTLHSFRVLGRRHPALGKLGHASPIAKAVAKLSVVDDSVIKIYGSTVEASQEFESSSGSIVAACKGRRKTAFGFRWRYVNEADDRCLRMSSSYTKPIVQMDESGGFIGNWSDAAEAAFSVDGISEYILHVCKGKRKTAYGYKWRYATQEEIATFKSVSES